MATNFNQFIPYLIAKKKAKKNGIKVPNEALLGMMPRVDGFLHNYLLTDVATKKAIEKKQKETASSMLNELVNNRVTELNAVAAGGAAADPLVLRTRALSPQLKNLIASRVTVPAVKTELLKP